jgi:hypothetical protein
VTEAYLKKREANKRIHREIPPDGIILAYCLNIPLLIPIPQPQVSDDLPERG